MNPYKYVCELQNRNATQAQEAIEKALLSLLDEKELYKISVKELCNRANVARSTFYAYYESVSALMVEIENDDVAREYKVPVRVVRSLKALG